jgi:hypothetical protein
MTEVKRVGLALKRVGTDPADAYLDSTGNLALVYDAEAVGQHARQRLKSFEGEWFLNRDDGVPWFKEVLGHGYDPALAEAVIKSEVIDTDGVTDITTFSVRFNRTRRELQAYDISVSTVYDEEAQL